MMIEPAPAHRAFYDDLTKLLRKHSGAMSSDQMLAVASQMVGKIIALQDRRKVTPEMAMEIVRANIEMGNAQVIDELSGPRGRA